MYEGGEGSTVVPPGDWECPLEPWAWDVAGVWGGGRHHQDAVCWEVDGSGREPGGVREGGRGKSVISF